MTPTNKLELRGYFKTTKLILCTKKIATINTMMNSRTGMKTLSGLVTETKKAQLTSAIRLPKDEDYKIYSIVLRRLRHLCWVTIAGESAQRFVFWEPGWSVDIEHDWI